VVGAVLLSGCPSENTVELQTQLDTFAQAPNNKVDILWVVDDSNSMAEEQAALGAGFASFAGELESSGTDFQIGLVTTSFEYTNPDRGKLIGDPPFLTNADADYEAEFVRRATAVGTGGSDKEKGLEVALYAVSPLNVAPGGINEGFVRSDAQLLVVIVSDEEDCSDGGALEGQDSKSCYERRDDLTPVNEFVRDFRDLKSDESLVSVGVIVGPANPCAEVIHGERYLSFARLMGGLQGDICTSDWSGMLGGLGLNATGIREQFQLSKAAQPETIVVYVDETEVPEDPANGWTYDVASWYLTFHGSSIPPRGATITVDYTVDPSRVAPEGTTP
jgi:hypothetical protein